MADIVLTGSGDFSKLKQEYDKLLRENVKLAQSLRGVADESNKAAQKEAELARAAKKIFDDTRTPMERYNAQMAKLNELVRVGKLDQETFGRAAKQAHVELENASKRSLGGINVGAMAAKASMAALTFSIGAAKQAFDAFDAKKEEAATREKAAAPGLGQLKQLAENQEEYDRLVKQARQYQYRANIPTMDEASREVFDIHSAGRAADINLIADLRASKTIGNAGPMLAAVDALVTSMGEEETGDLRAILSKAALMGKIAPGSIEQNIQALARGASTAKAIGMSDEELMAMQTFTAKGAGDATVGGTVQAQVVSSLMDYKVMSEREARKKGIKPELLATLKTGSLVEKIQAIEAAGGLEREEFQNIRGEERARKGYLTLVQNLDKLPQLVEDIRAAPQQDIIGKKMALTAPELDVELAAGRAKIRKEWSERGLGIRRQATGALQDEREAFQRESGWDENIIWAYRKLDNIVRMGTDESAWLEQNLQYASPKTRANLKSAGFSTAGERGGGAADLTLKVLQAIEANTRKGAEESGKSNRRRPPAGPQPAFSERVG